MADRPAGCRTGHRHGIHQAQERVLGRDVDRRRDRRRRVSPAGAAPEVPDPPVYPQQAPGLDVEVDIQYRVMDGAAPTHSEVPVAPLVGYEADPTVLGAPFFVMGFVDGEVPIESPPYTESRASSSTRRPASGGALDRATGSRSLAAVHRVDWRAAGLELARARPAPRRDARSSSSSGGRYARRELDGRDASAELDEAFAWLRGQPARRTSRSGLCWGDPRPGNIIWQDFEPVCVTDFEAVSIALARLRTSAGG